MSVERERKRPQIQCYLAYHPHSFNVIVGAWQRLGITEMKWMCSLADKREWILFRTSHITTHKDDDSFLVYFHAFAVSAFKCLHFVIQQVRIYGTIVGIEDVCWCYLDTRCD